ncbi:hypothetical protein THAOC_18797, partial [Thalassiosira oceanica]
MAAVRGDDAVLALLGEMTGGAGGGAHDISSETPQNRTPSPTTDGLRGEELARLVAVHGPSPPTNPRVEIIRHRCHERFKGKFYELFRGCAGGTGAGGAKAAVPPGPARRAVDAVWSSMPSHSVWERYQFALKTVEAECVRELRGLSREPTPSWCIGSREAVAEQLLNPTAGQIVRWTRENVVWEPLLPVTSVVQNLDDAECRRIDERYRKEAREAMEGEVGFQFRRTFKRMIGGSTRGPSSGESERKKRGDATLSLDELYDEFKSLEETKGRDLDDNLEVDTCKKSKKKSKKRQKEKAKSIPAHVDRDEKEEYVFRTIFESKPYQRTLQKLAKKFSALARETYESFLAELTKTSNRLAAEEQSRNGGGRRKRRGKADGDIPRISAVEPRDDDEYGRPTSDNDKAHKQLVVSYAGVRVKVNETHRDKLHILYERTLSRLGSAAVERYLRLFPSFLFSILLRYDALEGAGLQSAIPPNVFRYLNARFGCDFECFASPFNCWLDGVRTDSSGDGANLVIGGDFGSAFGDTDAVFGSNGSFFDLDLERLAERRGGCCLQANPPFSDRFIERMCRRMDGFIDSSNKRNENVANAESRSPVCFVVIVPAWRESKGWNALCSSPHLSRHLVLDQKDDEHYYAEGTQHRRSAASGAGGKGGAHRVASFDTSVFFLVNDAAGSACGLSDEDNARLKRAFAMKSDEVRGGTEDVPYFKLAKAGDGSAMERANGAKAVETGRAVKNEEESERLASKQKPHEKKRSRKKGHDVKKKRPGKKKKLVSSQDEMGILASMGILDDPEVDNKKAPVVPKKSKKTK